MRKGGSRMADSPVATVIGVPDEQTVDWLEKQFGLRIREEEAERPEEKKEEPAGSEEGNK